MRTGDKVFHKPSGETWLVAYEDGGEIAWCGWPGGLARTVDCELVYACTDAEHEDLLRKLAEMSGSDFRKEWAARKLAAV